MIEEPGPEDVAEVPDLEEETSDPQKFKPPPWLTEPYAILRVHVREFYRLQRARIRATQQFDWLKRWYPTVRDERLATILQYGKEQRRLEEAKTRLVGGELKGFPIWTEWLESIRGVGPILAGNILGECGPAERFEKVSAYWRYWGGAVVDGRSEIAQEGVKRHFSRHLKVARWKLGKSFVMVQGPYREWFVQRKRKEAARAGELNGILLDRARVAGKTRAVDPKAEEKGLPPGSVKGLQAYIDARARRWTVKLFLSHHWEVSRELAGRPAGYAYAIAVLGHPVEHHIAPPNWTRRKIPGVPNRDRG